MAIEQTITKQELIEHLEAVADIADRLTTGNLAHRRAEIAGTLRMRVRRIKKSKLINEEE